MRSRRLGPGGLAALALPLAAATALGVGTFAMVGARARPRAAARDAPPAPRELLRVCADPNNLPFSNARGEGLENRLAELLARDLGREVRYTWWPQRRGFVRHTLKAGACDVVMGVPYAWELVERTRPYYRSTYVFLTRADRHLDVRSFDDPRLHRLRVGVQLVGDDYANTPPVEALSNRGVVGNIVGYSLNGDYGRPNPPARIVEAVADGEVDVAVVWGPLAGYFAGRLRATGGPALALVPVSPQVDVPFMPFVFDIAVGVARGRAGLRDTLDAALARRRAEVGRLLAAYGVPLVELPGRGTGDGGQGGNPRPPSPVP